MTSEKNSCYKVIPSKNKIVFVVPSINSKDWLVLNEYDLMDCASLLNKLTKEIRDLEEQIENYYKVEVNAGHQYRLDVYNELVKVFDYAEEKMQENIDNSIVYSAYKLLRDSIEDVAEEVGVDVFER